MKTIKIAGVPEHFNLPWHLCIDHGEFDAVGIDLQWTNVPEGTGKMCQMLRNNETDIAIILTEGIVKDIVGGNPSSIIQVYVDTPLIWGIHVDAHSDYTDIKALKNKTAAISRYGSGSHLMAFINAQNQSWDTSQLKFEIVNTIEGAVEALASGKADYFMWEKFMTQPFVDKGVFRRITDCPTPWPCFVIAVTNDFLQHNAATVQLILEIINATTLEFKDIPSIDRTIASKYNLKLKDVQEWLSLTKWSQKPLEEKMVNKIQNQLFDLNIIDKKVTFAEMVKTI
jgi:ABC-type nitrate/sulfonate/bicarbonate transport system substrate-binding protein